MKNLRLKLWSHVLLLTALIYSTLGIVRPVCEYLKANTPFSLWMNTLMIVFFFGLSVFLFSKIRLRTQWGYFFLAVIIVLYVLAFQKIQYPEEKLHLLEYGLLDI